MIAARKSEAFSILSGGIAHDYNNLLSVIWGNISLLREEITDPSTRDFFAEAEKACEQARSLTHQFITLSRGARLSKSLQSVKDLLSTAIEKTGAFKNIDFSINIPDQLPTVEIDPEMMLIAIQNIIINAAEAMPGGGKLEIRAETKPIESGVSGATKRLHVIFMDHGSGIAASDLPQVFDPYFTTKERGSLKGMGLGLAVSQSILIKHGGNIQIYSAPEQGTSVVITLPSALVDQETPRPKHSGLLADNPTILLLEDNPSLRKLCGQMLERLNCEVISAGNGNEAVEKFNSAVKNEISIRLVLLDLNIKGGLGGIETLKRLRESGYEKPAIVVTGSPDSPRIRDYQKYGFNGMLLKPYTKKELEKSIRQFIPF